MSNSDREFIRKFLSASEGNTEAFTEIYRVPTGYIFKITNFSLVNTHATQTMTTRFGFKSGDIFHCFEGIKTLAAVNAVGFIRKTHYCLENDIIGLHLFGSGATTTYDALLQGFLLKIK